LLLVADLTGLFTDLWIPGSGKMAYQKIEIEC